MGQRPASSGAARRKAPWPREEAGQGDSREGQGQAEGPAMNPRTRRMRRLRRKYKPILDALYAASVDYSRNQSAYYRRRYEKAFVAVEAKLGSRCVKIRTFG